MTRPLLDFVRVPGPAHAVLVVTGEVDMSSAHLLDHHLSAAQTDHATVLLDLTAVRFLSAAGVDVIVTAAYRADETGGRLVVVAAEDSAPHRTITLAGTVRPVALSHSVAAALRESDREPLA
ncbi:STAS domain-containing protein [Actinokineospora cianjurensis]|uniref:Anti-anti-sigma factor n=1 Tax=Actinokineospora cianjurensis TaxID=585224 RepID=A0A421AWV6_9PSEU|nr:STAS domain-containing protein [Actinokineospora cianjurensis]RLK54303.1 anti-anti-sigma factor [Actinokineospora cianjurensis]